MNLPNTQPTSPDKGRQILIAAALVVIGLAALAYSAVSANQQRQRTHDYVSVQGTVIAHQEVVGQDRNSSPITRFAEVVAYPAKDKTYTITSSIAKTSPAAVGTVMAVQYNPNDPAQAILSDQAAQTQLITLIAGGACMLLGVFLLVKSIAINHQ